MNLDQVLELWDQDAKIDVTDLAGESLGIPRLHAKWLRILSSERLRLKKLEAERSQLRLAKHEFYTQGETRESREAGWTFPARGMVLNKDVHLYNDADPQTIEMNLRVSYQAEVVAAIELIFKSIMGRNWEISRALEDMKFKSGIGG